MVKSLSFRCRRHKLISFGGTKTSCTLSSGVAKKKKKKSSGRLSIYTKYSSQSYLSCWESFSVKCSHLLTSVISYSLCFLSLSSVLPDLLWAPWPVFITSEFLQAFRPWPCVSSLWFMASPGFQTLRYKHLQDSSPWHFMGSSEIISKTAYEPYTAPSSQNNHLLDHVIWNVCPFPHRVFRGQ